MSSPRLHALAILALAAAGCAAQTAPQLKVLGVERARRSAEVVVLVQVVNHAKRPMHIERLQYSFGADGAAGAGHGEVALDRTVEADAAVIVQVPLDLGTTAIAPGQPIILDGELYAHENALQRTFPVHTEVTAPAADDAPDSGSPPSP